MYCRLITVSPEQFVLARRKSFVMAEKLSLPIAKRRIGVAISSITRLEKHVIELEAKEKLSHKDEW